MAVLNNSNAISPSGYDINNSLRFRSSASAYLNRTFGTPTSAYKWTLSFWIKLGTGATTNYVPIFAAGASPNNLVIDMGAAGLRFFAPNTGATVDIETTQVFRDPSAWYHVIYAVDTTQATASNRVKLYVNGSQVTAFSIATYPSLNATFYVNQNATAHYIGNNTGSSYFDGYFAEVNFIDGQALTPSSFGESDATTGVWKAKKYAGTYGTNGFYLNFSSIATTSGSNAGLGKDWSGNTNYFNTNNISVTAGTTYDAMTDSPTLTSATVSNYATWNPLDSAGTPSNANLTGDTGSSGSRTCVATMAMTTGKWYWEMQYTSGSGTDLQIGIIGEPYSAKGSVVGYSSSVGWFVNAFNGYLYNNGSSSAYGTSFTTNDIVSVAYDADTGKVWFAKNGTWMNSGNPATATNPATSSATAPMRPAIVSGTTSSTQTAATTFGQRPFSYTPPTGFKALNTYNLPDSTIKKGNSVMDASLYTGTGSALNVTNDASFKPDLVWIKGRSSAYNHALFDSVRGALKIIQANSTAAEVTETAGTSLTGFNSNGFALGTNGGTASTNVSGQTFVGWQWQAGQGSTSSGTGTGGITNVIQSVNSNAGFSVVTYTGSGAAGTITHGLGVAPKMIIIKNRSAVTSWYVYHIGIHSGVVPEQYYLNLDTATANLGATAAWNDTQPTSSVFSVGTLNSASTNNYVAYCWAEVAGFSKFGWYSGNGSTDGPFVYTGFRPKFVIWKSSSAATTSWCIHDTARNTYNVTNSTLSSNTSSADGSVGELLDILSNGFKIRSTDAWQNTNGGAYIFAAFAENPFKNALAR